MSCIYGTVQTVELAGHWPTGTWLVRRAKGLKRDACKCQINRQNASRFSNDSRQARSLSSLSLPASPSSELVWTQGESDTKLHRPRYVTGPSKRESDMSSYSLPSRPIDYKVVVHTTVSYPILSG
jgi:hypothetical protein